MKTRFLTKTIRTPAIHAIARKNGWDEDESDAPMDYVDMDEAEAEAVWRPFNQREDALAHVEKILPGDFFGAVFVYLEHWDEEKDDWIAEGYWEMSEGESVWSELPGEDDE
jgi:hypothetical protein